MLYEFKGFTEKANRALNDAISQAEMLGSEYVGSEHILLGILKEEDLFSKECLTRILNLWVRM